LTKTGSKRMLITDPRKRSFPFGFTRDWALNRGELKREGNGGGF